MSTPANIGDERLALIAQLYRATMQKKLRWRQCAQFTWAAQLGEASVSIRARNNDDVAPYVLEVALPNTEPASVQSSFRAPSDQADSARSETLNKGLDALY